MRGRSALPKPFTTDTSILRRQDAVSGPFQLGPNPSPSLPLCAVGQAILTAWYFQPVRVSHCADGISCIVTCSPRAKSSVCRRLPGIPCVTATRRLRSHGRSICTRSLRSNAERWKEWRNFLLDPNRPKLLEPCKGQISKRLICRQIDGGRDRVRTCDPLLAKQT